MNDCVVFVLHVWAIHPFSLLSITNFQNQKKMKNLRALAIAILMCAGIPTVFAQTTTETIKVSGNCGMCEKTIETAAKKAGAATAKWDEDTKVLSVTYDAAKTSNDAIQKAVANSGYDTEKYAGDDKAYKKLHSCCQYDNKRKG